MQPLFFDDLRIGMEFRSEFSAPLTENLLTEYAALTGDRVHKRRPDGRLVVQGNLVTGITGGVLFSVGHFNETLLAQTRKLTLFKRPVYAGERICAIEKVVSLYEVPGKPYGKVALKRYTYNEGNAVVQEVDQEYYVLRKPL